MAILLPGSDGLGSNNPRWFWEHSEKFVEVVALSIQDTRD